MKRILLLALPVSAAVLVAALVIQWGNRLAERRDPAQAKSLLEEIDRLADPSEKGRQLEAYVAAHPDGPHLLTACALLLELLKENDPDAAIRLAEEIVGRDEPEEGLRYYAYLTQFAVHENRNDAAAARSLARRILLAEEDPEILLLAARHDPENEAEYRRRHQESWDDAMATAISVRRASIFELNPDEWGTMSDEQRAEHLLHLIDKYRDLPTDQVAHRQRFPFFYHEVASVLARLGRFEEARLFLDKIERRRGSESHHHLSRAALYESAGRNDQALEEYLRALSFRLDPRIFEKAQELSDKLSRNPEEILARARLLREQNVWLFPELDLKRLDGTPVKPHQFFGRATVLFFHSPG